MISILLPKRHQPSVQQVLTRLNRICLGRRQAQSAWCPLLFCEIELWDRGTKVASSFHPFPDDIYKVMDTKLGQALFYSSKLQASFSHLSSLDLCWVLDLAHVLRDVCWSFSGIKFKETIKEHMVSHTSPGPGHTLPRLPALSAPVLQESSLRWSFHRPEWRGFLWRGAWDHMGW